ncbi:hypothetical protein [Acinetobacter nosocomialis]
MGNSAGLTYAMLALSVMFPAGERFFIQSVKKLVLNLKRSLILIYNDRLLTLWYKKLFILANICTSIDLIKLMKYIWQN